MAKIAFTICFLLLTGFGSVASANDKSPLPIEIMQNDIGNRDVEHIEAVMRNRTATSPKFKTISTGQRICIFVSVVSLKDASGTDTGLLTVAVVYTIKTEIATRPLYLSTYLANVGRAKQEQVITTALENALQIGSDLMIN